MDFPPVARRVGKLRLSVSDRQIDNVNDGLRRRALLRVNTPEVLAKMRSTSEITQFGRDFSLD